MDVATEEAKNWTLMVIYNNGCSKRRYTKSIRCVSLRTFLETVLPEYRPTCLSPQKLVFEKWLLEIRKTILMFLNFFWR